VSSVGYSLGLGLGLHHICPNVADAIIHTGHRPLNTGAAVEIVKQTRSTRRVLFSPDCVWSSLRRHQAVRRLN